MNSTLLVDAIPFGLGDQSKTVVIQDCVETDGTFILTHLVSTITMQQQKVLWIGCGSSTQQQIIQSLKKAGCDVRNAASTLWTHSIPTDLATQFLNKTDNDWDPNEYLRQLYQTIQSQLSPSSNLIVLDDVTALALLCGKANVFYLLQKLRSLSSATVIFKCSLDLELDELEQQQHPHAIHKPKRHQMPWIAAGGRNNQLSNAKQQGQYWEQSLVELADEIIHVLPLPSGFSKQVHGRIVFTSRTSTSVSSSMVNYYLSETQGAQIMRLRSKK